MVIVLARALDDAVVPLLLTVIGIVAVVFSQNAVTVADPDVEPAVTKPVEEIVAMFVGETDH
jgi:hypothetical protein